MHVGTRPAALSTRIKLSHAYTRHSCLLSFPCIQSNEHRWARTCIYITHITHKERLFYDCYCIINFCNASTSFQILAKFIIAAIQVHFEIRFNYNTRDRKYFTFQWRKLCTFAHSIFVIVHLCNLFLMTCPTKSCKMPQR